MTCNKWETQILLFALQWQPALPTAALDIYKVTVLQQLSMCNSYKYIPLLTRFSSGNSGKPVTCRLLLGGSVVELGALRVNLICCFCPDSCKTLY